MNLYVLNDPSDDRNFLANQVVSCPIAASVKELEKIQPGNSIVVQLSNRKKYKGVVRALSVTRYNDRVEGTMEIIRT
jgi:hypothetical protein